MSFGSRVENKIRTTTLMKVINMAKVFIQDIAELKEFIRQHKEKEDYFA